MRMMMMTTMDPVRRMEWALKRLCDPQNHLRHPSADSHRSRAGQSRIPRIPSGRNPKHSANPLQPLRRNWCDGDYSAGGVMVMRKRMMVERMMVAAAAG